MGELTEAYSPNGLNLGECIKEIKRIAGEVDYNSLVKGDPETIVKVGQLKQVIEYVAIPELVGYEEKEYHVEA